MLRSMVVPASALALILTASCSGKDDTDDTDGDTCTNAATPFPASGATNIYYRTTVEAKFQAADQTATLTVDGVNGTTAWRGNTLVFTPDAPLAPNTSYNVSLSYTCGDSTWSFTTSEVGAATDVTGLNGRAYALDLNAESVRFVQPEGVGDLLGDYLTTDVLMGVESADASSIQMIGAIGIEGASPAAQDTCNPTIPFPQADFTENPYFQAGPATTTINVEDYEITINDLLIAGAFAPDGSYISGAVLSGSIDTRPLAVLLDDTCTDEGEDANGDGVADCRAAICDLAVTIGVACETCTDGKDYCLSLYVDGIVATELTESLVEIPTQEDACLREECAEDSDCAVDTDTSG